MPFDLAPKKPVAGRLSVGFLTALVPDELKAAQRVLRDRGWQQRTPSPEQSRASILAWSKVIGDQEIYAYSMAINDMGQARSAIETAGFLARTRTTLNFLIGIAGSLYKDDVHREDVVIGTEVFWRGQDKISDGNPCPVYRQRPHDLPRYTNELVRRVSVFAADTYENPERGKDECDIKHRKAGKIFTWDYVVNSPKVTEEINTAYPQARCVEMEAGGFLSAIETFAHSEKRPSIGFVVRGISDYAAGKVDSNSVRLNASASAATVAIDMAEWLVSPEQYKHLQGELWRGR